jgi:hypothetical protein
MSVIEVEWSGGSEGRERPLGGPFLCLERSTVDGWKTVATDVDLGFVWFIEDGHYTARYEVPRTMEAGKYRLRVTATGYELETEPFGVVPCTDIRVLGVELKNIGETQKLIFRAQNPPPKPDHHLRSRRMRPKGGKIEFEAGGKYTATWNPETEGWVGEVEGVTQGDELSVPKGALTDGAGNSSGDSRTFEVGELDCLTWVPNMETGGGNPPGLFGIGEVPR